MLDKIQRSWRLLRTSLHVIREHPKLLLFPLLIGIFTTAIALFFFAPILFLPTGHSVTEGAHWKALAEKLFNTQTANDSAGTRTLTARPWLVGYGAAVYLLSMIAATFCNVAFNSEVLAALNGEPVSLRHGIKVACGRIKSILVWSLFAGLVGLIIRQIEERLALVGKIIAGFIGLAWSVSCVFVIPVLVREEPTANPIKILGRSAGTIKRTWGELLTGYIGLSGANMLVFLSSLLVIGGAVLLAVVISNFWILVPVGLLWLGTLVLYGYFANVASQVYLCALYIYASEGVVPKPYDQELLDQAWKMKKR